MLLEAKHKKYNGIFELEMPEWRREQVVDDFVVRIALKNGY